VETVSTSNTTLQDRAYVGDFLNVAATETAPLFMYLEFEFLLEYNVLALIQGGEYEYTNHRNSSEASRNATTKTSTEHAQLHENSEMYWPSCPVALRNRPQKTLLIGFSPKLN